MTSLADFSAEDAALIASLPYKVGMWISHVDDRDGDDDDVREAKALSSCLRHFAKSGQDRPFTSQVLEETLRREEKWEEWADQSFNVLREIGQVIGILRAGGVSGDDLKAFKRALMEIGSAVAGAASEFGSFDEAEKQGFFSRIIGKFSGDEPGHPMNVSAAEGSALEELRLTLREKA